MADQREEQRKKLREASSCEDEFQLKKDSLPSGRPTPDCDEAVVPAADAFVTPEPCPTPVTPAVSIPEPLVIGNLEVTETCPATAPKNGPNGLDSTVAANRYTRNFHFTTITGITDNQLSFISTISVGERAELADESTTVSRIVEITGLSTAQATELNNSVSSLQTTVDTLAATLAYDSIDCYWENTEQTANCSVGAITNAEKAGLPTEQQNLVNNPSTVAAGTYKSSVSQAVADAAALAEAQSELLCLFGNAERTRTCLDIGFSEAITDTDSTPDTLDGQVRKGSYTVTANSVFSSDSIAAANAAADAVAEGELNCFYPNEVVVVTCAGEGRVAGSPGTTGPPVGNPLTNTRGQSITMPAGFLTSLVSTADANDIARDYALSLLECWICNQEQVVTCPTLTYVDKDGNVQNRTPSPNSDPVSVTVAACTIKSEIDQNDANTRAALIGEQQLGCVYCNPQILPVCVPPEYATTTPVPISSYDRDTWSRDATRGVPEDYYCCTDNQAAQTCYDIADTTAGTPIDSIVNDTDCRYANTDIYACCSDYQTAGDILENPDQCGSIPAGTFLVGESAGGQTTADQVAEDLVKLALGCRFCNEELWGCPDYAPGGPCSEGADIRPQPVADFIQIKQGYLPECSFTSPFSTAAANVTSQQIANGGNAYVGLDEIGGADGLPGDSGAQTSCNGNCSGYYSA